MYSQTAHAYEGAARIFLWGGYDDPGLFGPYIEKHGEPEYATFGDAEEGLKKLKAGFEQDVAWPCQGEIKRWVRGGVLQPLDISRMEHWNDMFPEIRDLPSGIVNGEHYFAPVDWGDTSLTYNTEKINWMSPSQGNESLTLMEDPRLKGKLGILNSAADSLYVMMHYLGTDITKSESLTKSAIDQGINKYRELRDNGQILTFFDSGNCAKNFFNLLLHKLVLVFDYLCFGENVPLSLNPLSFLFAHRCLLLLINFQVHVNVVHRSIDIV